MKPSELILLSFTILLFGVFSPNSYSQTHNSQIRAETFEKINKSLDTAVGALIVKRLDEINAMDKSRLSFTQKRELRKEVRDIKKQLKQQGLLLTIGLLGVIAILLLIILNPF